MSDTETVDVREGNAEEGAAAVNFEEAVEAILFAAGHPVTYVALARVLGSTPAKVRERIFEYSKRYNESDTERGVILLVYGDSAQLCTKEDYLPQIRDALGIRKSGTLSSSSMETLAIVAYNQPVTRLFVDTLRRADSSYAMNNLLDRGLIESRGRLDVPGRPMLYGTTNDFLRCFGINSLTELPKTSEELVNIFAKTKNAPDPEEEEELNEVLAMGDAPAEDESASENDGSDGMSTKDAQADVDDEEAGAENDTYDYTDTADIASETEGESETDGEDRVGDSEAEDGQDPTADTPEGDTEEQ